MVGLDRNMSDIQRSDIQGGPKVGIQYVVYSIITVYLILAHPVYDCLH